MSTDFPYCIVPPEQHYDSCQELLHDILFFEERRAGDRAKYPSLLPPSIKFELVKNASGKGFYLFPATVDYGVLYRGQTEYFNKCLPTLYRSNPTPDEVFMAHVRIAEFRLLLEQYEITKRFEDSHYNLDYIGLAQHYGLDTDALDFTSDIRVALFFAMCDYNPKENIYTPKTENKNYIGYLYAVIPLVQVVMASDPMAIFSDRIHVIGLQPFLRPGRQKGYSFHVGQEGLSQGYLYSFSYTKEDSLKIFDYYDGGKHLWCEDEIAEYAKMIKSTHQFTDKAVSYAVRMFDKKSSVRQARKHIESLGYRLVSYKKQPWSHAGNKISEAEWKNFQSQVFSLPLYSSQRKTNNYRSTKNVGLELSLNYIFGSVDSPQGYDSGLSCRIINEGTVMMGADIAHSPLEPSSVDGKLHAQWKENNIVMPTERSFVLPEDLRPRLVRRKLLF